MTTPFPDPSLPAVVRTADGRVFDGELPATRHLQIFTAMLHERTSGLVELAAGRRKGPGEKLHIYTRDKASHFLPGGRSGAKHWLRPVLSLAEHHRMRGEELFVAVGDRYRPDGGRLHVAATHWLWVDVDGAHNLDALYAFFSAPTGLLPDGRNPHLVTFSAGSGGAHAYWKLRSPLPALIMRTADGEEIRDVRAEIDPDTEQVRYVDPRDGQPFTGDSELIEPIEKANLRLIHGLGHTFNDRGRQIPTVADPACRDRARVMRAPGLPNGKTGEFARILFADASRSGYTLQELIGDLPDPKDRPPPKRIRDGSILIPDGDDPFKRIPLADVYERLTSYTLPQWGDCHCPHRDHPDNKPSCTLGDGVWYCFACQECGGVYQLAAAVLGLSTRNLRGNDFLAAKELLRHHFGDLDRSRARATRRHPQSAT